MSSAGTPAVDPNSTEGIVAALVPLVQAGIQAWDQQSLFQFNQSLIQQGKQPLTTAQIQSLMTGVTPSVNLGLTSDTQTLLGYALMGAAALAALYILLKHA